MDDVTWGALALTLTVLGGLWTWWAFRHRGAVSGVRGIALTLLPAAAWLTGTLALAGDVATAVGRWSSRVVLSPAFWLGAALAGTSVLLLVVTWFLGSRARQRAAVDAPATRKGVGRSSGKTPGSSAPDDEFADIEAMLRRRGIE